MKFHQAFFILTICDQAAAGADAPADLRGLPRLDPVDLVAAFLAVFFTDPAGRPLLPAFFAGLAAAATVAGFGPLLAPAFLEPGLRPRLAPVAFTATLVAAFFEPGLRPRFAPFFSDGALCVLPNFANTQSVTL